MELNIFGTGHCIFHDIDEDAFIMNEIVFWYATWLRHYFEIAYDMRTSIVIAVRA